MMLHLVRAVRAPLARNYTSSRSPQSSLIMRPLFQGTHMTTTNQSRSVTTLVAASSLGPSARTVVAQRLDPILTVQRTESTMKRRAKKINKHKHKKRRRKARMKANK